MKRYTVKIHTGHGNTQNLHHTNNYAEAISLEDNLRKIHGADNVWIADTIEEILVG